MAELAVHIDHALHNAGVSLPMWATGPGHSIPTDKPLGEKVNRLTDTESNTGAQLGRWQRPAEPGIVTVDDAGNVLGISDVSNTGTDTQCFKYDHLARLTEAWSVAATGLSCPGFDDELQTSR